MKPVEDCVILIVEDTPENIDILMDGLGDQAYDILIAKNGEKGLKIAEKQLPDLILLDVMMPGIDGYEVCRQLKANPITQHIPVVFLTALDAVDSKAKGFSIGGVDYVTKPFEILEVKARVNTHLQLARTREALNKHNESLEATVQERTKELQQTLEALKETQLETIIRLGLATEMRDDDTGQHIHRIRTVVKFMALKMGIEEEKADLWGMASTMHDIGKVGIPDAVLKKPGRLTEEEFDIIKTHTLIGARILSNPKSELIRVAHEIALSHHEKWNGKGYPNGISSEEIPLSGRITAIADVFDALLSKRPYKDPWPMERVLKLIEEEAGEHFDPELVKIFLAHHEEIATLRDSI